MCSKEPAEFKLTSIPIIQNYEKFTLRTQSNFLRSSSQHVRGQLDLESAARPDPERGFSDIIVIHPGSRNIYLGVSSSSEPIEESHVIARRLDSPVGKKESKIWVEDLIPDVVNKIEADLKPLARNEAQATALSPMSEDRENNSDKTPKSDHRTGSTKGTHVSGRRALNMNGEWELVYPILHGSLNTRDYCSMDACVGDMVLIWKDLIMSSLDIPKKDFKSYNILCIIPDLFSKQQVNKLISLCLLDLDFRGVSFIQESVAASFASAINPACIVDIGAGKISISCVEDGVCVPESRIDLKYGGDDVTRFLLKLLQMKDHAYKDFDIENDNSQWQIIEEMKEKCNTDVIKASMILFYPEIIDFHQKLSSLALSENFLDYSTIDENDACFVTRKQLDELLELNSDFKDESLNTTDDPESGTVNPALLLYTYMRNRRGIDPLNRSKIPLHLAIIQSITKYASCLLENKIKDTESILQKIYTSIILTGKGSMTKGLVGILEEKITAGLKGESDTKSQFLPPKGTKCEVVHGLRDISPEHIIWKGAAVFTKISAASEVWIGKQEWLVEGITKASPKFIIPWW